MCQPALGAALLAACAGAGAADADTSRFPLGDRAPFGALLGIPDGWTGLAGPRAEMAWSVANNAVGAESGGDFLLLDGETHTVTLRVQRQFGTRLSLGATLPWVAHSGGFLDPLIDSWHDAFGLSEGIRPSLPRDDLRYVYGGNATESFRLDRRTSGLGDLHSAAVLRLAGAADAARGLRLDLTADADWPTGDEGRLTGNNGIDLAAGVRLGPAASSRFDWMLSGGLVWPGDLDLPFPSPAARILYYDLALAWTATPALDLILQLNGHDGAYRSRLGPLGRSTLQLGTGALWRLGPRYGLRLGVFEDLRTDSAPDFAIELALMVSPGR